MIVMQIRGMGHAWRAYSDFEEDIVLLENSVRVRERHRMDDEYAALHLVMWQTRQNARAADKSDWKMGRTSVSRIPYARRMCGLSIAWQSTCIQISGDQRTSFERNGREKEKYA